LTDLPNKTELEEPENLIPYSNNPKEHPEAQIDEIASSIKNYGFVQPVVVDSENEVIIGHGRLKAANKLGLDEIPVIRHDDITDSEAKALRLADNKIAESEWEDLTGKNAEPVT
jgi:ParB/RepB/Spo0J family partition protein